MAKIIKRGFASVLAAVCLVLCACDLTGIRSEISTREYETDFSAVHAETIYFSGMKDADFENSINAELEQAVESDVVAFDSEAQASTDKVRMGNKCVLDIKWKEAYNNNDFISVVEEKYIYTGGAHGNTVRIPRNIDLSAKKQVQLADLFEDDGYKDTLNRLINERIEEDSEAYKDLWAKPEIKEAHQTDFYIEGDKLVIFFQPYDLSYYARGFVEFPLDTEELSGYMKEEYRRLIGNT